MKKLVALNNRTVEAGKKVKELISIAKFGRNDYTIDGIEDHFDMSEDHAKKIIDEFYKRNRKDGLVIDYDHSTLDEEKAHSGNAPASGWVKDLILGEDGLYGKVKEWTKPALERLGAGEYKYISPVLSIDELTKTPSVLHSIGLTNHPAMHCSEAIAMNDKSYATEEAKLFRKSKSNLVDIKQTIEALQVELDKGINNIISLTDDTEFSASAKSFINKLNPAKQKVKSFSDTTKKLLALSDNANENDIDRRIKKLIAFKDTAMAQIKTRNNELLNAHEEIAELKAFNDATTIVNSSIVNGKILEANRDWAMDLAIREPKRFNDFILKAPRQCCKELDESALVAFKDTVKKKGRKKIFNKVQLELAKQFGKDPNDVFNK